MTLKSKKRLIFNSPNNGCSAGAFTLESTMYFDFHFLESTTLSTKESIVLRRKENHSIIYQYVKDIFVCSFFCEGEKLGFCT